MKWEVADSLSKHFDHSRCKEKEKKKTATLEIIFDTKQLQMMFYPKMITYILNIVYFGGVEQIIITILLLFIPSIPFIKHVQFST